MGSKKRNPLENYALRRAIWTQGFSVAQLAPDAAYEVGKCYWCNYWGRWYQVLEVERRAGKKDTAFLQVKVKWQDGTVATHATNLNPMEDWEVIWPDGRPKFLDEEPLTQEA